MAPGAARADYLVLANGDSLTGRVVSESPTTFTVATQLLGQVVVRRADIASLTRNAAPREEPSQLSSRPPTWSGNVNSGLDVSHGNSPSSTIAANAAVTRIGTRDKLAVLGTSLVSTAGAGDEEVTTARALRGGVRYDHDLGARLFAFGFGEVEHDRLQLLDLRTVAGAGVGVHALRRDTAQINLTAGATVARDKYIEEVAVGPSLTPTTPPLQTSQGQGRGLATAPGQTRSRNGSPPAVVRASLTRTVEEWTAGVDAWHAFNSAVSLTQRVAWFAATDQLSDYRVSFDLSLNTQLTRWLQWNLNVSDRYLNIPPAGGAVQNDAFVSTGLGVAFGGGARQGYGGSGSR
jgi:putative salt-induced outer membrane protein YdiY